MLLGWSIKKSHKKFEVLHKVHKVPPKAINAGELTEWGKAPANAAIEQKIHQTGRQPSGLDRNLVRYLARFMLGTGRRTRRSRSKKAADVPGWSNTASGTQLDSYITPQEAQQS